MTTRQFCAHCLTTTDNFTTEHEPNGRRFHYCSDIDACARRRGDHNGEPPVYRAYPTIWGRPANPGETEDAYIERVMHENYVTASGYPAHGSME